MPELALPWSGLPPAAAVWRLLQLKGHEESLQAFRETWMFDGTPESLVEPLGFSGIHARPAIVEPEDLAYLDLPTLLQVKDGSWLVLRHGAGHDLLIEAGDGLRRTTLGEVSGVMSGAVLDVSPSLPEGATLWQRLKGLLLGQKKTLVQILLVTVLLQLLALIAPEITGLVMDRALPDGARSLLHLVALGVVLVALFQAWASWLREQTLLFLTTRLEVAAERGFLEHLLRLPFPFLQQKTLGDFLQAFSGLMMARELLAERAIGALLDGVMALVYLAVMAIKMPWPTLVVVLVAGAMVGLAVVVGRVQAQRQTQEVEAQAQQRGFLTELISGVGTVKAAGAEQKAHERWMRRFDKELGFTLSRQRVGLWSEVGLDVLRQGLSVALLIWGGQLILKGELKVGTLFSYLQLSAGFLAAMFGLVGTYLLLVVLRPQLAKAQEILAIEVPSKPSPRGGSPELQGPVIMEDVWFRYTLAGPWILKEYNLRVEVGDTNWIHGPSGFGKSTILRLLAGLYVPEKGTITIGGLSPQVARRNILYLPQFVQLYGGSIIENLRVLSGGAPLERILAAAEQTGLQALVATLPMNYQTVLPHGGKNLSGGQRQLIALTAALASERALLLLDEPMANLDALFVQNLTILLKDVKKSIVGVEHG